MNREIVLEATSITKRFTKPEAFDLLQGIDLTLYQGERVCILGQSGEGKTTLLHILATLDTATSGSLSILGKPVQDIPTTRNRDIGFVFQSFCLLQDNSCLENLLLPAWIARQDIGPNSAAMQRALELLERVQLSDKKLLPAVKLSGGQMQRLAIARAFMNNPSIIFADEPTGNLDHQTAHHVQELLFSWVKSENKTLCLVTHNLELAKQCDRVFCLEGGRLLKVTPS